MIDSAAHGRAGRATGEPALRASYAIGAAGFVAYAIWGSLFPFDFHRVPAAALAAFWTGAVTGGATWSLTDLLSNVLLFLPIGLFCAALAEKTCSRRGTTGVAIAAIFGAGAALSTALEIGQAFVSARTPSLVDVAAEAVGFAGGIALWRYLAIELDAVVSGIAATIRAATRIERALLLYCAAFAIAWWLPADFTLRPAEIGDKFVHKRLLLPFAPSPDAASPAELAVTAVAAVPLGVAAVLCGCGVQSRRSVSTGAAMAALFLIVLELGQIPVFSRTTDGTALLAALAGAAGGAAAARSSKAPHRLAFRGPTARAWMMVVLWLAVTAVVEWWPFHIVLDPDRARLQTTWWSQAPFRVPASLLDVLPGTVMAAAAGAVLRTRRSRQFVRMHTLLIIGCGGALFLTFETARVLLAGGRPTLTSVLIETGALTVGLCAGPIGARQRVVGRPVDQP
jgi:glycopeptide antibiotics resistance protein